MKLSDLLQGTGLGEFPYPDAEVSSLSYDTRTLQPGALYFALAGYKTDGHLYIREALAKGAVAVVCREKPDCDGLFFVAEHPRAILAAASAHWFGHPGDKMTLVAVTGTNGKTTTTYLLKSVLEQVLHTKVGLVGTNQNMIGAEILPASRTTPESYELQALLRKMADGGCTHVVMEASSHALVLHRTGTLRFAAGVFTNLTQDHLDFHRTMEAYRDAKGLLFQQTDVAVLNLDDEAGRFYEKTVPCPVFTYSENRPSADVTAKNIRLLPTGVAFEAMTRTALCRITLPIPGCFSIYNALGVISCSLVLGLSLEDIAAALALASGVKGRAEVVPVPADFTVMIDYAHSPDALENILLTAREFTEGRVIAVFGCGGDRDREKRPMMGGVAARLADLSVVTSDNPRTEPREAIIAEILAGMPMGAAVKTEPHRRAAIRLALSLARKGDTVLLCGKGHETYQEENGLQNHLDEREEIADYFSTVAAFQGGGAVI
ncbi:MAG: UDP-N-acetylmuramoyl-L-alanyl-D-glutamate--2,6-diaminopimelate ligase [Oscillospiraceae bacterium]